MRCALLLGSATEHSATAAEIRRFSYTQNLKQQIKTIIFYSRKAAESEENICHFLLRQLVHFKPL